MVGVAEHMSADLTKEVELQESCGNNLRQENNNSWCFGYISQIMHIPSYIEFMWYWCDNKFKLSEKTMLKLQVCYSIL